MAIKAKPIRKCIAFIYICHVSKYKSILDILAPTYSVMGVRRNLSTAVTILFLSPQGHLERSLTLRDDDPMCFYLLGRWCYEVRPLGDALVVLVSVQHSNNPVCVSACVCVCIDSQSGLVGEEDSCCRVPASTHFESE